MQQGRFRYSKMEQVVFGVAAADAIAAEARRRAAERVFLVVSGTLNRQTDEVARVREALGQAYAGCFDWMPAHSPRSAVVEAAAEARAAGADLLVTIGGGSVTDGAKVMQICLAHDVTAVEQLDAYHVQTQADGSSRLPSFGPPTVRQITVPTTLSGGEFNALGGCTDDRSKVKQGYVHPLLVPVAVILDPAVTVHTPEWLWLSTGVRALDHCVEGLCSPGANAYCDAALLHALRLLSRGLPRVKAASDDLDARLDCLMAAWLSMTAVVAGVPMGASHAIGHILGGTCDVPHGYTSCVMLPAVLRWNAGVEAPRQALVAEAMGHPGEPAADVVAGFVADLGLPRTLADVGVTEDRYDLVAQNALHDRWLHTNPRPVSGTDDVLAILRLAA